MNNTPALYLCFSYTVVKENDVYNYTHFSNLGLKDDIREYQISRIKKRKKKKTVNICNKIQLRTQEHFLEALKMVKIFEFIIRILISIVHL